ncbi:MAG: hypothetical protein M3296_10640, partial [Actinomycetota bacterium]|nr:hypothetical protein [Actinomycetota bacterium]
ARTQRRALPEDLPERLERGAPAPLPPPVAGAPEGVVRYHTTGRRLRWRPAVITGLLGFLACALVFTVPELVAGKSASGGGRATTLFGGHHRKSRDHKTKTTTTRTTTAGPAQTVTVPPATTVTAPARTTEAPTRTTPAPTTTPPPSTTPPVTRPPSR